MTESHDVQFHGVEYLCTTFVPSALVPGYENVDAANRICSTVGSVAGSDFVSGTSYIGSSFRYESGHKWRNVGILIGFLMYVFSTLCLMYADEIASSTACTCL